MNTKSRRMLLVALVLAVAFAFGGGILFVSASAADGANGWVAEAPAGASAQYGSNLVWPLAPADKGNGFTEWCFNNNHLVANETPLDVSKPIVLTYSTVSNVSPDGGNWIMFGLATSFEGATKMTPGFQEAGNLAYSPFFYAHQAKNNVDTGDIGGAAGAGSTVTVDKTKYTLLTNKCGEAYKENIYDESATVTMEIYLGAEASEDGYILIDGLYVGYPNVVQSAYADCTAYLAVSSWNSGWVKIKVENKTAVTDIKDYNISASVQNAQVVLQDNALWRANADEEVSFTVENVAEGYRVAEVKAGSEVLAADADGVYSFTMPAGDTIIEVVTESKPDTYAVKYEGTLAVVKFDNGTGIYSAGDTVSFTVEVKDAYSLDEVVADGEVLKATDGVYTFEMPNKDVVLTIKVTKQYSAPSDQTIANAVNSWNTEAVLDDPAYGPIVDGNGSSMVNEGEGYSNFALNNGGSISSVIGFDVTKPIYLDILIKPNGPIPGNMGWFMIGMYDDWNIMLEAGVDGYGNSGTSPDLNEKINEYLKACIGFGYNDINSTELPMGVWKGLVLEGNFSLTNKFGDAWEWSDDDRKTDFDYAKFEFYIGATAEDGYIKIDGVKVATPQVTQADFHDGTAYFHLMSFYSSRVQAKIYSQSEFDATTEVASNAKVTFAPGTELNTLMTYDEVAFTVEVPDGYGALVSLNGVEIKPDADGNYTAVMGYGKNVLKVAVDETVTVTFNTNGFGSVENAVITKGGTITEPVLERAGYTLQWYADANFTTVFDFTAAVNADCTVYAKWTAVEYSISYYDGANKIRDLSPTTYNAETDTFSLPIPKKEGMEFDGWYTSASFEGEKIETVAKGTTGDLVLYAKWKEPSSGCSSSVIGVSAVSTAAFVGAVALAVVALKKKDNR